MLNALLLQKFNVCLKQKSEEYVGVWKWIANDVSDTDKN
jgi:hypothetical protein